MSESSQLHLLVFFWAMWNFSSPCDVHLVMHDATRLPKDVDACHTLIAELTSRLHRHETLAVEQSEALVELHGVREQLSQENEELKLTIKKLLARLYTPSSLRRP